MTNLLKNDFDLLKLNSDLAAKLLKIMVHRDQLLILCHLSTGEISAGKLARRSLLS